MESPDDPILLEEIADISFSLDRFDDALRYAGRAITMAPQRAGPHVTAALAYEIFDRRPASVAALLVLVFSGSLAEVGVVLLRLDRTAAAVRGGYVLLLAAACGAGFAHLLFFLTWLGRRGGDRDAAEASGHAVVSLVFVTGGAIVLLGVIAALRHWSRQPTAFWVLVVLACGIALTLLLESVFALYPDLRPGARWIPVLVAAVAVTGMWWGAHEPGSEPFRSTERLSRPTVPRFTPKPLPTMPSFRVTVAPAPRPTGDR
ncbi:tetratricopeptide repeat protein [Nocardia noduli]|uniref:tetratricopeptide repeat protein n=1 Tax=Nocardia noduli TaxID=2815722 RepID=UPI001C2363BE|nr:hypothetical protein [Nocardia noduli]